MLTNNCDINESEAAPIECARELMGTLPRLRRILLEFFPCVEGHLALTLPQFFALSCLYSGESLPSHLSRRLMVSKPTATVVVDGLVKRGLVERGAGPDDRRQVTLRLTPAGRRVCEAHRQAVEQRLCRAFAGLGTDELQRLLLALRDLQRVLQPDAQEKET